jgi:hypothetical protein
VFVAACGTDVAGGPNGDGGSGSSGQPSFPVDGDGGRGDGGGTGTTGEIFPELWYCVDQLLVHVELGPDGTVKKIQSSTISQKLDSGQSAITMLNDGSLLVSRLSKADNQSYFFHVAKPPRDGSPVTPTLLGVMPNKIMIEGLYTDCKGRLYAMDTGSDDSSAKGNRLLRFTGNVTGGDYAFVQVSDLGTADVADIDDMGPGINSDNKIVDNPGLAIDTGHIYAFNFETGKGKQVTEAGTYGIHALGGSLFGDKRSRLYVMNESAQLFEINPTTFASSKVLGTGPKPAEGAAGWSSLAGPLTDCAESGFVTQPK